MDTSDRRTSTTSSNQSDPNENQCPRFYSTAASGTTAFFHRKPKQAPLFGSAKTDTSPFSTSMPDFKPVNDKPQRKPRPPLYFNS